MRPLKTEFVVTYTTIIDLQSDLRSILNPYSEPSSRIIVQAVNRPEENIRLVFAEDLYVLECNWNRVKFISERTRAAHESADGQLRFFFRILSDLSDHHGFSRFKEAQLTCFDLIEGGEASSDAGRYIRDYLSDGIKNTFDGVDDVGIQLIMSEGERKRTLVTGPYDPANDPENYNIKVLDDDVEPPLRELSGMLARTQINRKCSEPAHGIYVDMLDESQALIEDFLQTRHG